LQFDLSPDDQALFLAEVDELLQRVEEALVDLERQPDDQALLQEIFRAAHTIKGSSATIGHIRMAALTHAMETRLDDAGCSIGAEPYSMSIILRELALGRNHSIMATDIDQTILDRARGGRDYLASDIRNVGSARMAKWFTLQPDGRYSVGAQPRTMITFQKHDLLRDRYPRGPFDLVSCRNVVIYFTEEAKERIYQGFVNSLRPGGILFVGGTEAIMRPQALGLKVVGPGFYRTEPV